jgi:hypothetical protein
MGDNMKYQYIVTCILNRLTEEDVKEHAYNSSSGSFFSASFTMT